MCNMFGPIMFVCTHGFIIFLFNIDIFIFSYRLISGCLAIVGEMDKLVASSLLFDIICMQVCC